MGVLVGCYHRFSHWDTLVINNIGIENSSPMGVKMTMVISALQSSGYTMLSQVKTISTVYGKYTCMVVGHGKPTVVLESGLGDGMETWAALFEDLAEMSQVFAYNRGGYRKSYSKNRQRDGFTIVAELRALLMMVNLVPPYLLVGHSMGGTYMELFARRYPDEVAGVVFIDARHADFTRRCQAAQVALDDHPSAVTSTLLPPGARGELKASVLTMHQIKKSPPFPEVPIAVLTGMNKPSEGETFRQIWLATQKELVGLSSHSKHIICRESGHYLHQDNSAAVVDALRWVLAWRSDRPFPRERV